MFKSKKAEINEDIKSALLNYNRIAYNPDGLDYGVGDIVIKKRLDNSDKIEIGYVMSFISFDPKKEYLPHEQMGMDENNFVLKLGEKRDIMIASYNEYEKRVTIEKCDSRMYSKAQDVKIPAELKSFIEDKPLTKTPEINSFVRLRKGMRWTYQKMSGSSMEHVDFSVPYIVLNVHNEKVNVVAWSKDPQNRYKHATFDVNLLCAEN